MSTLVDTEYVEDVSQGNLAETVKEYLGLLRRYLWLILIVTALATGSAAWWTFSRTPVYQGVASVVVESSEPKILETSNSTQADQRLEASEIQTHVKLMTSFPVLQETVARLNISEAPEYEEFSGTSDSRLLAAFSENLGISTYKKSNLIQVSVNSENADFSAEAANTLAAVYIDHIAGLRGQTKQNAAQWFETHIDDLRSKLTESEVALHTYETTYGVTNLPKQQQLIESKLAGLTSELNSTEMKRVELETRRKQVRAALKRQQKVHTGVGGISGLVGQAPILGSLESVEVELARKVALLNQRYGPRHPKMIAAKNELEQVRAQMEGEARKGASLLESEYLRLVSKEKALRKGVNDLTEQKNKLDEISMQYRILDREAASNRHLFDLYLKQMREADISTKIKTSNIFLAEVAMSNSLPIKPKKARDIALGFLLGLMGSVGFVFAKELLSAKLKGPKDFERQYPNFRILGVVPLMPNRKTPLADSKAERGYTAFVEDCYAYIRTNVLLAAVPEQPVCLTVTSPGSQEGKTTLVLNLAKAFSQLIDSRVILIDGDFRCPKLDQHLELEPRNGTLVGLSDYLSGLSSQESIVYPTAWSNVFAIPAGSARHNPAELLHSKGFGVLLHDLRLRGYHVFIDAPPGVSIPDALIIAKQPLVQTILTINPCETTAEAARLMVQRLVDMEVDCLGVVMQKTPMEQLSHQYHVYQTYAQPVAGPNSRLLPQGQS